MKKFSVFAALVSLVIASHSEALASEDIIVKRESAERSLRAFLADTIMIGKSFCLAVKLGKPGKDHRSCLYEKEGENQRPVQWKSTDRELLAFPHYHAGFCEIFLFTCARFAT